MKNLNTVLIAVAVVVVGLYLVKRNNQTGNDATVQAPAGAGSRGTSQENVPAYAGQGAPVPSNPFTAFLQGVQSYEWAMA
jgi:hypothetical protein